MSALVPDSVFYSTLQPNTTVTTYALPSETQLGSSEAAKSRVQQQIQLRLAEKSSAPRQNGSSSNYAMSDYGGSSTSKYNTYSPGFSSRSSYMYPTSRTMLPGDVKRQEFSSRSAALDSTQFQRMSIGGGGGGGFYQEGMRMSGYTGSMRPQSRIDPDAISVHSVRNMSTANPWLMDSSDAGSLVSDRDATYNLHTQSAVNGFGSLMRQGGGTQTQQSVRISRGSGMMGGGAEGFHQQQSFKGPSQRTITRITNRNRMSVGPLSGNQMTLSSSNMGGGDQVDRGFMLSSMSGSQSNIAIQHQGNLMRSTSMRSVRSVGMGGDIYQTDDETPMPGFDGMDLSSAVANLSAEDSSMQVLGAAYIQHECFHSKEAKDQVRLYKGIPPLVNLFSSDNQEVQLYAAGAVRNLIYENLQNKIELIQCQGIEKLAAALEENREHDFQKNVTGILWNLSSREDMKERVATTVLDVLCQKVLVPLTIEKDKYDADVYTETPSQKEIYTNATGCLRNLSSGNEVCRKKIRETTNMVDCLMKYIDFAFIKFTIEEKGLENTMCILRNLSFQLYSELPAHIVQRLNGDRNKKTGPGMIGCFTPQSKKAQKAKQAAADREMRIACRDSPNNSEWLYHPTVVTEYHRVIKECDINSTTPEAAIGALQNITSGDQRWASMLSDIVLGKERMMASLLSRLSTERDSLLRSITGLMRNLSRNASNKTEFDANVIMNLIEKLTNSSKKNQVSNEVTLNILATLNQLVVHKQENAYIIFQNNGVETLIKIRDNHDCSVEKNKAASSAATVLSNMYVYKPLHKKYHTKYGKKDFLGDVN